MLAVRDRVARRPLALGGMLALASAIGIGRFVYRPLLPAMAEGLELIGGTRTAEGTVTVNLTRLARPRHER